MLKIEENRILSRKKFGKGMEFDRPKCTNPAVSTWINACLYAPLQLVFCHLLMECLQLQGSERFETMSDAWSTDVLLASDTSERQAERLMELEQVRNIIEIQYCP